MSRFEPKTFKTILKRIVNKLVARTKLTDLNDGGTLHVTAMAVAREIDDVFFQMSNLRKIWSIDQATADDLDARARDYAPDQLFRGDVVKATTTLTFGRLTSVGVVPIPIGSIARVPGTNGPKYKTTASGSIANGDTASGAIPAVALIGGTVGNADAGTITALDAISGVQTVTNTIAATGGADAESDQNFRSRIKAYMRSLPRGVPLALKYAALSAHLDLYGRVVSASVVEGIGANKGTSWVYVDDGAGTTFRTQILPFAETILSSASGGEVRLFLANKPLVPGYGVVIRRNGIVLSNTVDISINNATGQINFLPGPFPAGLTAGDAITSDVYTWFVGLVQLAQKIIDGDPGDPTNYPGYRAAGTNVYVLPPDVYIQLVVAEVVCDDAFNRADVLAQVSAAILRYVNGLGINGDVIYNELVRVILSVTGTKDVNLVSPSGNVVIGDGKVARITATNIVLT